MINIEHEHKLRINELTSSLKFVENDFLNEKNRL